MHLLQVLKLCLVTQINHKNLSHYLDFLQKAIQGGITSVQFRDKSSPKAEAAQNAFALKAFLKTLNIPLIINDDVFLAKEVDAEGVHLGQRDLSPIEARQILGSDKIIGLSIETDSELIRANKLSCIDYFGLSSVFKSQSKHDCITIWGLQGLKKASEIAAFPIVAIGGINQTNAKEVISHGASGIAVISALHQAPDPQNASAALIKAINQGQACINQ